MPSSVCSKFTRVAFILKIQYYLIFPGINMEARRQQILSEIDQLEDLIQAIIDIYIPQINEEIETLHQLDANEFFVGTPFSSS